jgi:hypothetical protein
MGHAAELRLSMATGAYYLDTKIMHMEVDLNAVHICGGEVELRMSKATNFKTLSLTERTDLSTKQCHGPT